MITDPKEQREFFTAPETVTNPDEFKSWFNENYVRKDKAAEDPVVKAKVSGGILGSEMTNFYRTAKENGIEFDAEEKKAIAKNEDLFSIVLKKQAERLTGTYVNQIEELKKTAGQGSDEKVKAVELEKEKLAKKLVEVDAAWKTTAQKLEDTQKQSEATLKNFKISTLLTESEKGVKFKQKMTEVEKMGYEAAKATRLKFDLGETGDAIETFNAKGERIVSKNKAGTFLNATEALQELANELGLAEINPHGGKQIQNQINVTRTREPRAPTGQKILFRGKPTEI